MAEEEKRDRGSQQRVEDRRRGLPVSRRAAIGSGIALVAASTVVPAWLLGPNMAWAMTSYGADPYIVEDLTDPYKGTYDARRWPNYGTTFDYLQSAWEFPQRVGLVVMGFSPTYSSPDDGHADAEVFYVSGVRAVSDWATPLYWHYSIDLFIRVYRYSQGRAWHDGCTCKIKVSYGSRSFEEVSYNSCLAGASTEFSSMLTSAYTGGGRDSYFYPASLQQNLAAVNPRTQDEPCSLGVVCRRVGGKRDFDVSRGERRDQNVFACVVPSAISGYSRWRNGKQWSGEMRVPFSGWPDGYVSDVGLALPAYTIDNDVSVDSDSGYSSSGGALSGDEANVYAFRARTTGKLLTARRADAQVTWDVDQDDISQNLLVDLESFEIGRLRGGVADVKRLSHIVPVAVVDRGSRLRSRSTSCRDDSQVVMGAAGEPSMAARWWIDRRAADHFVYCDVSGKRLGGSASTSAAKLTSQLDDPDACYDDERLEIFEVTFSGSLSLDVGGQAGGVPVVGKRVTCPNPFGSCRPKDRSATGAADYVIEWFVGSSPGECAQKVSEDSFSMADHASASSVTLMPGWAGSFLSARVRIRMMRAATRRFYPGSVVAACDRRIEHRKVRFHLDDPNGVWKVVDHPVPDEPYVVDASITEQARKWNCHHLDGTQGFDGWYADPGYSTPYVPTVMTGEYLDLYGRNWATLTYASGGDSGVAETFSAGGAAGPLDEVVGMPAPFEKPYGTLAVLVEPKRSRAYYEGPAQFPLAVQARRGWHATPECTGDPFSSLALAGDTTVYKKWISSTYDGIVSNGD